MRLSEMIYTEEEMQELKNENKKLKEKYDGLWKIYTSEANELKEENKKLKEENRKLIEFKLKHEEMMFLVGASIYYLAEPKTALDAEKLQKGKKIFEKIYNEKLHSIEEENKKLKEENKKLKEGTAKVKYMGDADAEYIKRLQS